MKNNIFYLVMLLFVLTNSKAQIITTIAGSGPYGLNGAGGTTGSYAGDGGPATIATLNMPFGITLDTSGIIYFGDQMHLIIRKINNAGIISTIAGNDTFGFGGGGVGDDGPATAATFLHIDAIMTDNKCNLYIPDFGVPRIRKINTAGIINTIAGDSIAGHTGDGGPASAAELGSPTGIAFDKKGNLYFIDDYIRKINTHNIISTIGGNGVFGYSGDGGSATNASFKCPADLVINKKGDVCFTDECNYYIRKIDSFGIITTIAGSDSLCGYSGDGAAATAAKLCMPEGIIMDVIGTIYFSDYGNNVVRKIDTAGIITTIVGNGIEGFSGDGGPATAANLDHPAGLAFDKQGNLYIADQYNNRVRKVTNVGVMVDEVREVVGSVPELNIYPNPTTGNLTIEGAAGCSVVIYDMVGRVQNCYGMYSCLGSAGLTMTGIHTITCNKETIDISNLQTGIYIVEVVYEDGERIRRRMVKD